MGYYHNLANWGTPARRPYPNPNHAHTDGLRVGEVVGSAYSWESSRLVFCVRPGEMVIRIQEWDDCYGRWKRDGLMFCEVRLEPDDLRAMAAAIANGDEWEWSDIHAGAKRWICVRRGDVEAGRWPVSARCRAASVAYIIHEALYPGWAAGI